MPDPIALIAAVSRDLVIGVENGLPWHLPEDLRHFRALTTGKPVIMGRKTWESIAEMAGGPLKGRLNIVISRQSLALPEGVLLAASLEEAIELGRLQKTGEVMVMGGAQIYQQAMTIADTLYITHVDVSVRGDAHFPAIDPALWKESKREDHQGKLNFSFVTYRRQR
jgi:dihydrofolate reductase